MSYKIIMPIYYICFIPLAALAAVLISFGRGVRTFLSGYLYSRVDRDTETSDGHTEMECSDENHYWIENPTGDSSRKHKKFVASLPDNSSEEESRGDTVAVPHC